MSFQRAPRRRLVSLHPSLLAPCASLALLASLTALTLLTSLMVAGARPAEAQSLYGSPESMARQNLVAQQHDYAFLRTTDEVMQAVAGGVLVAVHGNEDLDLAGDEVSYPYARPEVKTFLEQLGQAYHATCGEPLVITSLTRPLSHQPWNASPISVHPTGMAVDMRRPDRRACRQWLESTLLALEGEGMIEATREHWPPHYHVAVFPDPLLLPGPIGDPTGVVRLAALHRGVVSEPEYASAGRRGRLHVVRSRKTGRLRVYQTAVARRSAADSREGRISVHRHGGGGRHGGRAGAVQAVARHHFRTHATRQRSRARGSAAAQTAR